MSTTLADDNFKCIFLNENYRVPIRFSLKFVPRSPNWQCASIGSGNGLVPNRRQAITWINANRFHWRIYAALGGYEFKNPKLHSRQRSSCWFCLVLILIASMYFHNHKYLSVNYIYINYIHRRITTNVWCEQNTDNDSAQRQIVVITMTS